MRFSKRRLVLVFLSFSISIQAAPSIRPLEFQELFLSYQQSQRPVPPPTRHAAEDLHYVFVAGYLNEVIPGYFRDLVKALRAAGVRSNRITMFYPPSRTSARVNSEWLAHEFAQLTGRKVIVAHSKGVLEVLLAAVQLIDEGNESFLNSLEALFLLKGAVLGTPLADVLQESIRFDGLWNYVVLQISRGLSRFIDRTESGELRGLQSLSPTSRDIQYLLTKLSPENVAALPTLQALSRKSYFVTSEVPPKDTNPLFSPLAGIVEAPNDAFVSVSHQVIPQFGTRLIHLQGDHLSVAASLRPLTLSPARRRAAFMRAVFELIERDGGCAPTLAGGRCVGCQK